MLYYFGLRNCEIYEQNNALKYLIMSSQLLLSSRENHLMSVSQNSVLLSEKKGNRAEKSGTVCWHAATRRWRTCAVHWHSPAPFWVKRVSSLQLKWLLNCKSLERCGSQKQTFFAQVKKCPTICLPSHSHPVTWQGEKHALGRHSQHSAGCSQKRKMPSTGHVPMPWKLEGRASFHWSLKHTHVILHTGHNLPTQLETEALPKSMACESCKLQSVRRQIPLPILDGDKRSGESQSWINQRISYFSFLCVPVRGAHCFPLVSQSSLSPMPGIAGVYNANATHLGWMTE